MSAMQQRYDEGAEAYQRWWAPVLAPSALAVLDLVAEPRSDAVAPRHLVDLGTGTGVLARAAVRRWPAARIDAADFSRGMLAVAGALAERELAPAERRRVRWLQAHATALPFADGSVDAVVSSFVVQLVPSRPPVYREALRVLRPGGRLAFVSWLADETPFAPHEAFDDALDDVGVAAGDDEERLDEEARAGDFVSVRAASDSLRRAGFRNVHAEARTLEYGWTRERFADYKLRYDEHSFLEGLDRSVRRRVERRFRERIALLPADAFTLRAPVVYARGDRPG